MTIMHDATHLTRRLRCEREPDNCSHITLQHKITAEQREDAIGFWARRTRVPTARCLALECA